MGISRYFNSTSSVLLLLCIGKPDLVKGPSTRLANHTHALIHTCKNGGYRYFTCLYPQVISNSVSLYWHKYPVLKFPQYHVAVH